ncbi:hypothetical protein [Phaeobacter sp. JH204B]|uniref:hypothetical protein n=1 Tax=Phaeobacter sp. JH204B TaxID=3112503 RepID=UPI003A84C7B7
MTDLIKAADALAEEIIDEIECIISDTHDIDVTDRNYAERVFEWVEESKLLTAYLKVRESADGVKVKPLVWDELGDRWNTVTSGRIQITQHGCHPYWDLSCASPETDGYYNSVEEAKAAAQADHEARIKAALEGHGE